MMKKDSQRDLGPQPLMRLMTEQNLKPHDLVAASEEQLTHKMVTRALKGRRLTSRSQHKVLKAFCKAAARPYKLLDLFTYT